MSQTTEDQIFDIIIDGLPADSNEYYIQNTSGSSIFTVKKEQKNGR